MPDRPEVSSPADYASKFDAGPPGVRSPRWTAQPNIAPCEHQDWHIQGESYQSQLYCSRWKEWINPSGFTCKLCRARQWPVVVIIRDTAQRALDAKDREEAENIVVQAVESGSITRQQGEGLAHEFGWIQ